MITKKKSGLSPGEKNILKMAQELYGKRYHQSHDCSVNEDGNILLFIKNRKNEAQFAVNLSLLANIHDVFAVQLKENFLMPDFGWKPQLLQTEQNPRDEYQKFIAEQFEAASSPQRDRIAS